MTKFVIGHSVIRQSRRNGSGLFDSRCAGFTAASPLQQAPFAGVSQQPLFSATGQPRQASDNSFVQHAGQASSSLAVTCTSGAVGGTLDEL